MKNLIAILLFAVCTSSCGSTANEEQPSAKYQEKKNALEETERNNPLQFMKMTNNNSHSNLVSKMVIESDIANSATLVAYKDIEVGIIFKDEKGAVIEKDKKTLNLTIAPNSRQSVKIKVKKPKGTVSVLFDITGATPVNK